MSQSLHTTSPGPLPADRWQMPGRLAIVPSWLLSLLLHAGLLFLCSTTLNSCGATTGTGEGEFRNVGLYLKDSADASDQPPAESEQPAGDTAAPFAADNLPQPAADRNSPPTELLSLPSAFEPQAVIGPGTAAGAPRSFVPGDVNDLVRPRGTARPDVADAGDVTFFGAKDTGTRFVYVLDSSGSMTNHNAIRIAKAELTASLGSLDATQQFQVIFYNTTSQAMTAGSAVAKLYWATDINRTLARQFIAGIQPDGGTSHLPALKKALQFSPDVIFFLTDADEPQLSAAELDEIRKANRGRARIHCVEFGTGAQLAVDNFLKKLARQNGGMYQYRDVTTFDRRP